MSKLKGQCIKTEKNCYELIEHLKDGGNGSVWKARSNSIDYAVKFLNQNNSEKTQRFLSEISFSREVEHDNIIMIHDCGEHVGKPFYVMPIYESNLSELINHDMNYSDLFEYILQICEGLKFIHRRDVIHRDLKPDNILIEGRNLVLADFGIAHFEDSTITKDNDLLANRPYAAPEQKKKGMSKEITTAVDIYALGCIINEMFTKENPSGTKFILISEVYPWLCDLDKLVELCLRQSPLERPSIDVIITELKLIIRENSETLEDIKYSIETSFYFEKFDIDSDTLEIILDRASEDLLSAKYIFERSNENELYSYNHNYNCFVHYKIDETLKRICFDSLLYEKCERKFSYESNVYGNSGDYKSIDLDYPDNCKIYKEFESQMKKYGNVNGKTLKLFLSCCDYHCKEILRDIASIKEVIDDFDDAPILYIVIKLRNIFSLDFTNEVIDLEDHILVNWEKTYDDFKYPNKAINMSLFIENVGATEL